MFISARENVYAVTGYIVNKFRITSPYPKMITFRRSSSIEGRKYLHISSVIMIMMVVLTEKLTLLVYWFFL